LDSADEKPAVIRSLTGKVALVTGAGRGLGRRFAERLASEGANVVAIDLPSRGDASPDDLENTVRAVETAGCRAIAAAADVRDLGALSRVVAEAAEALGGHIDIVCANAGISSYGTIDELTAEQWASVIGVNLTGVWNTCKASGPHLRAGGAVCFTGSVASVRAASGLGHYVASKHGLIGLMKTLALEWAPRGVRVNAVLPSHVGTPLVRNQETFRRVRPDLENPGWEDVLEVAAAANPLGVGAVDADDVAEAVLFLVSERARYITGAALPVDAGSLL
jgi:SDR family mycofactocin-dependent oxidoreductase